MAEIFKAWLWQEGGIKREVEVSRLPESGNVLLGEYEVAMGEFLRMAEYLLTVHDAEQDVLGFIKKIKNASLVDGSCSGKKRLVIPPDGEIG